MGAMLSLNISDNKIGKGWSGSTDGTEALSNALKEKNTLKELNVSSNYLEAVDAKVLADFISGNGTISSVNLLKNDIGVAQAEDLVSILKEHPTLKSLCGNKGNETALDMSGKMNGAADAIMLVAEIIDNGALIKLDISNNHIGPMQKQSLQRICMAGGIKLTK
jgi:Ran GTPase-activating protein (RanGAP) involved in mRNA processing and transport